MKKIVFVLTLATLLLAAFAITAAADDEMHAEHKIKLKLKTDGDGLNLELSGLAVGDSQQFFTENGKEVIVTRTEEAYKIEVEGKDEPIIVKTHGEHGEHDFAYATGDSDGGEHHVVIKKHVRHVACDEDDSDCEHGPSMVFISKDGEMVVGDGGEDNVWVEAGAHGHGAHVVKIHAAHDAAQRLLDSGVLDDLPEAKRQEILEALKSEDGPSVMRIKKLHKEHGDHEEH